MTRSSVEWQLVGLQAPESLIGIPVLSLLTRMVLGFTSVEIQKQCKKTRSAEDGELKKCG